MAQIITIKRRLGSSGAPASGTGAGQVRAGELATSINPVGAGGVANLYIGDGTAVHALVSAARQIETTGNQTGIAGNKTFAANGQITIAPGDATGGLHLTGGTDGDVLSTDGAGILTWETPPAPVEVGTTAPGSPTAGDMWYNTSNNELKVWTGSAWVIANVTVNATAPTTPSIGKLWFHPTTHVLSIWNGAWVAATGNRIHYDNPGPPAGTHVLNDLWFSVTNGPQQWDGSAWVNAPMAGFGGVFVQAPISGDGVGAGTALGVTPATTAQIGADNVPGPVNNVFPITSAGLRSQLGEPVSELETTATTIVPAINELVTDLGALDTKVAALTGAVRYVGNYEADTNHVAANPATGTLTAGAALPPAAAANEGWYVIVTIAGTGTAPAPTVALRVGDWIVSNGAQWLHVPLSYAAQTAANVSVDVTNLQAGWTNVQLALENIYDLADAALTDVAADQVSIWGDGTGTAPATASGATGQLVVALVDGGVYP